MDVKTLAWQEKETVVSLRRHFHENPELSQKEFKTMDTIEEFLHKYGIETVRVPHGGVFGFLDSGKPGWTMLMRADIDALPIKEDPVNMAKERVCISENEGIMHACGHDGHMAMLLTEAKILAQHKDEWEGKIVFMFEEAEEMGERGLRRFSATSAITKSISIPASAPMSCGIFRQERSASFTEVHWPELTSSA